MLPYLSHKEAMKCHYGEALFSIPVNLDFGCPNRERDGNGGCTFCPEHGARAAQIADAKNVEEQIEKAIVFAKKRYNATSFALYIQAYTGTFASILKQKEAYERLLNLYPFKALHIGTRPDCLSEATLEYLAELNSRLDVVVELGVQSLQDVSLERINRGHSAHASLEAIERLHVKGLKVYAHLILGLPDESFCMWEESVKGLVEAGIDGIKFHNLHIISGTQLAREYEVAPFQLLNEYEYAEALISLLRLIPSHIPIIRLATDTPKKELIAPLWQMEKAHFGEYVAQSMRYRGIRQGDLVEAQPPLSYEIPHAISLEDGSMTFYSANYKDYYHPKAGAFMQAHTLFIKGSKLKERLDKSDVTLLDIGFGMGYNTLEALRVAQQCSTFSLHVKAMEQDRMLLKQSAEVVGDALHVKLLEALFTCKRYEEHYATVSFFNREARYGVQRLDGLFDVIFLDPFVEHNNASLVSLEFIKLLKIHLKPTGVLVASTSYQAVYDALILAGFEVERVQYEGSDIKGIIAKPLEVSSILHVSHPYRDEHLILSDKAIERAHQKSVIQHGRKVF
ncbi:TIGR01212 family radical SAM protein [Sulfurospirillum deleyianum]|uniref:Radical SAM domain protein n=1 Tax=Sulfurospirillum deleyianum (strain ATCC 51133 / DSM 6946 / 5175) TaxID=525898 RepID=D1B0H9_SULD5|nr:TIGR01212 family radical SAM protein [Sulfurospirillum deleyianum]ACZ11298.1 Radical SAM domain protein [Sulfurospirillum deleyianum DSM 6946]